MPPLRPRPPPKASVSNDESKATGPIQDAKPAAKLSEMPPPTTLSAMAPPPDPNAVVKTGQVYGFYADSRRLGIQKYASEPPKALTAALGREVEKYDQLCDAVEAQILRAITVLQRDLTKEQRRLQDAEKATMVTRSRSKSISLSPSATRVPLPESSSSGEQMVMDQALTDPMSGNMSPPPTSGGSASSGGPGRRGSTISLSSLHRPAFPHKLDLSATTLRITAEEASLFSSGPLASPVTLAPRSARPSAGNELPPDFMAAFDVPDDGGSRPVDIDLTVPDTDPSNANIANHDMDIDISTSLGSSVDKPIELDGDIELDMTDLFGDTGETSSNDATEASRDIKQDQESMDMDVLGALSTTDSANDIFASFGQSGDVSSSQLPMQGSNLLPAPDAATPGAPSPGTILASFAGAEMGTEQPSAETLHGDNTSFDMNSLDLEHTFGTEPESMAEIEELLKSGGFGSST
ncbi:hypothetical protein HWV62_38671 [Athelia sp. TMB]|nr:hypothetical protein HWV62_38671 [Athelia sp. TMB]